MKHLLIIITAAALLTLPSLAATQSTPIPPEAQHGAPLGPAAPMQVQPPFEEPRGLTTTHIREAQQALRDAGYDPGPIDGILGPRSRQALRDYQRDEGLRATGALDHATLHALLGTERQEAEQPAAHDRLLTQDEIRLAQENLIQLGFDPGPPDGVFTERTQEALRNYQERYGMVVSGQLDEETRRQLLPGMPAGGAAGTGGQ